MSVAQISTACYQMLPSGNLLTASMRRKGTGSPPASSPDGVRAKYASVSSDVAPAGEGQVAGHDNSMKASRTPEEALASLSSVFASGGGTSLDTNAMLRDIERYSKEYQATLGGRVIQAPLPPVKASGAVAVQGGPVGPDARGDAGNTGLPAGDPSAGNQGVAVQPQQPQQQPFQLPPATVPGQESILMGSDAMHHQLQALLRMHLEWQMNQAHQGLSSVSAFQPVKGPSPTGPMNIGGITPGMQYQPPPGPPKQSVDPRYLAPLALRTERADGNEDADSNVAALCLLAIERGEGAHVVTSNANSGKGPGERKRGRPQKVKSGGAAVLGQKEAAWANQDSDSSIHKRVKSCKYVGVRRRKWGTFASEIRNPLSGSREWLGTFDTPEEAAVVYDVRLRMIRGNGNARTNFPPLMPSPTMLTRVINPHGASRPEREEIQIPSDWLDQILAHKAKLEELRSA